MESTEDWMKRIGGNEALEQRILLRRSMKLNRPIPVRGLAALVGERTGAFKKHSLFCKCEDCIPPEIEEWMVEMKKWNLLLSDPRPVTVIPTKPEPKKRKSKWQQRGNSGN